MYCSTSLTQLPLLPRLPRGLVGLLILSLLLQTIPSPTFPSVPILPSLTISPGRWQAIRLRRRATHCPSAWRSMRKMLVRLVVRTTLLAILLHANGWATANALTWSVLIIPIAQTFITLGSLRPAMSARPPWPRPWLSRLERLYQFLFILLVFSTLLQFVGRLHPTPFGLFSLVGLSISARSPDHAAEICIERDTPTGYHITLRGAFELVWAPRDSFEKWMLILFLRRWQRVGETRPFLRQQHIADAFEVFTPAVSHWTREVETYGWHILSDRYRHQIHSALPNEALSRAILKTWVPAFAHVPSPKGWGGPVRG